MNIINLILNYKAASFGDSLNVEKTNSTRILIIIGTILYAMYTILDVMGLAKETLQIILPVRLLCALVLLGIYTLTYKQEYFQKHYNNILTVAYMTTAFCLFIAISLAQESDFSHNLYFAGLMLLIFIPFTWSYLPLKDMLIMSIGYIAIYSLIKIYLHKDASGSHLLTFIAQIFFLFSVLTVAAIAQIIRDNLILKNISLKKKLQRKAIVKINEVKKQQALANIDMLTGIHNRRYITEKLRTALIESEKEDTQLTLLFIDLNGFKKINDNYGHDAGDLVLEITAKRLSNAIRNNDYLARLGGDEFLLGFRSARCSEGKVDAYCNKLRKNILAPIGFMGNIFKVGASIGVAHYPQDGTDIESLIKVADKNMYADKQSTKQI